MTDDPTGHGPGASPPEGEDARDEQLAALLGVAPLEDHTRARLVRRALDEAAGPRGRPGRPGRWLAAAAVFALVGTGAVILAAGGDGGTAPVVQRARPNPVAGPQAGVPGAAAAAAPRDLGPVGDVTGPTRLRQVLSDPAGAPAGSLDAIRQACGATGPVAGLTGFDTVGTGREAGRPAAILVGRDARGRRVAVVVAREDCAVLQRLPLG